MDSIALSVFASRIESVCDEMGAVLQRVAFSPNIRDRLDYSCAVFDINGGLCAQAAHIPVHLGSMAYAARDIVSCVQWQQGDMLILNDPYLGGTHLPDITLIAPVFSENRLTGFVANRAHHADVGATSPGSMPISSDLSEEGMVIPPTHIIRQGELSEVVMQRLLQDMQNPLQSGGDFSAQISANLRGVERLGELIASMGADAYERALQNLNDYAARLASSSLQGIPQGEYRFSDVMDDDGQGGRNIEICVSLTVTDQGVKLDFSGTAGQVKGNINCPLSVAAAAVYYVFRCLMPDNTPACAGAFRHIEIKAPEGCLLNACRPAAVAAGNVETSTRVVDVVMGALAQAIPSAIPAASHGSMNNVAMGSAASQSGGAWDYYETIGGGMGGGPNYPGLSGVQTHMTNTLNTPVEVLELNYPLRVETYALRQASGGAGAQRGGDGLVRSYRMLRDTHVTVLSERRLHAPWGIPQHEVKAAGQPGVNRINGEICGAKFSRYLKAGDLLTIETPGGGGYTAEDY